MNTRKKINIKLISKEDAACVETANFAVKYLGLTQGFFSVSSTRMQTVLEFFYDFCLP